MKIGDNPDKYLDSNEKGWKVLYNWILSALIFIVLIAVGVHTYLITVGRY